MSPRSAHPSPAAAWGIGVAAVPLVAAPWLSASPLLPQAVFGAVWVLLGLLGYTLLGRPAPASPELRRVERWGFGLLLLGATSLLWTAAPTAGAAQLVVWATCALGFWLSVRLVRERTHLESVLRSLSLAAVCLSVVGLAQRFAGWDGLSQVAAPGATFGNRSVGVEAVVVLAPLGLAWLGLRPRRRALLTAGLALALPVAFILVSGVRAGLLALACQAACVLASLAKRGFSRRRWWLVGGALAGLAAATVLATWARPPGSARSPLGLLDTPASAAGPAPGESVAIRLELVRSAADLFRSAPAAGVGVGGYAAGYRAAALGRDGWLPPEDVEVESAHNDPAQLAAELGLAGLLLAAGLGWSVWRASLRRTPGRDEPCPIRLAGIASAVGFGVSAVVGSPAQRMAPALSLAVVLGSLAGLRAARAGIEPRPAPAFRLRSRPVLLAAGLLAAALGLGVRVLLASHARVRAQEAWAAGDMATAIGWAKTAVHRWPWDPRGPLFLASVLLAADRPEDAIAPLERLYRLRPEWVASVGNLARARLAVGDAAGALRLFVRATALAPSSERARAGLLASTRALGGISWVPGEGANAGVRASWRGGCGGVSLEVEGGRVDASGSGTLPELLQCLSEALGFELDYPEAAPRPMLLEIRISGEDGAPAIERLLRDHGVDYAMALAGDGRSVRSLLVFASSSGRRRPPRPAPPDPPSPDQLSPDGMSPGFGGVPAVAPFPEPRGLTPTSWRR